MAKQALGHPNLAPGLDAFTGGDLEVDGEGRLRFNNFSGRISANPSRGAPGLYLSHRLFRAALPSNKQYIDPNFSPVSYGRNNKFGANMGPLTNAEKDEIREVARVICDCAKKPSPNAPAVCNGNKPVPPPARLPGTPRLPNGMKAPMLVDQAFNAFNAATFSMMAGQETYNFATGNAPIGAKCIGVPLGTGVTLATGGTAVGITGTMLQTAGFVGAGGTTLAVGAGITEVGIATGGSAIAVGVGYSAGRGLDYATGNRISDSLAFIFAVPMDLFNSACDGELKFEITGQCADNFGRGNKEFTWLD